MIEGVIVKSLVTHYDERGYFREIIRVTDEFFAPGFGQWSLSFMYQDIIKAFHCHKNQFDYWFCVRGVIKAVVCDLRPFIFDLEFPNLSNCNWSKYDCNHQEFILGDYQTPKILVIPPGVAHGLKVLQGPAMLMYITSCEYNPQDEGRIPYNALGYDWFKKDIK